MVPLRKVSACALANRAPLATLLRTQAIARNLLALLLLFAASSPASADEGPVSIHDARRHFEQGRYAECVAVCAAALEAGPRTEAWLALKVEALRATGQYEDALADVDAALNWDRTSLVLRLLGYDLNRRLGKTDAADRLLADAEHDIARFPWRYGDAESRVAVGRVATLLGADPREVLEACYDRARSRDPDCRSAYLATGELALRKHEDQLAAEAFADGLERFPDDPDFHHGLARAVADGDSEAATKHAQAALRINPSHVPTLLFLADRRIDGEFYDEAHALLDRALDVDPRHALAWAYYAAIARIQGDDCLAAAYEARARRDWADNPDVAHLLGRKLSQKYRFAEGAEYQRQALAVDPKHLEARLQLAQDLLRLGREEEGWQLVEVAHDQDGYDVVGFNLLELRDRLDRFATLERDQIRVRMDRHEAEVYGDQVLELLVRARDTLGAKYDFDLPGTLTVEIFPNQSDFAVRTFGMPGGAGYLGVCFGPVITANSPSALPDTPANWQAVLWHEYTHTVTLGLTRNRMPRWLSEGISVYEERQADPTWGQRMTPRYRSMILGGELFPIGELSGAFLRPKSSFHVQFAYYQSSLVVEFLIDQFGFATLAEVLDDLGQGLAVEPALERRTGWPLAVLDDRFRSYAMGLAAAYAPEADWEPLPKRTDPEAPEPPGAADVLAEKPTNVPALLTLASQAVEERRWADAKPHLETVLDVAPTLIGSPNPYVLLARVERELGNSERERELLARLDELDADARESRIRLLEIQAAAGDWQAVRGTAARLLAVDPFRREAYHHAGMAAQTLGEPERAVEIYETLLTLGPARPSDVHYELARLHATGDLDRARRHVLLALESAPRFRAAHRLLLELHRPQASP